MNERVVLQRQGQDKKKKMYCSYHDHNERLMVRTKYGVHVRSTRGVGGEGEEDIKEDVL